MKLTPEERKRLKAAIDRINDALATNTTPQVSAYRLQEAEDILRHITRRQFWSKMW